MHVKATLTDLYGHSHCAKMSNRTEIRVYRAFQQIHKNKQQEINAKCESSLRYMLDMALLFSSVPCDNI